MQEGRRRTGCAYAYYLAYYLNEMRRGAGTERLRNWRSPQCIALNEPRPSGSDPHDIGCRAPLRSRLVGNFSRSDLKLADEFELDAIWDQACFKTQIEQL